jgi:hypothetical protein
MPHEKGQVQRLKSRRSAGSLLQMPLNPKNRDGLEKADQEFLRIIDEYDWHVMEVAPRAGEEGDIWAYSTGLYYRFNHPEIIVFNQKFDLMHSMINTIGSRIRDGEKFETSNGYADIIDNYDCRFRTVDVSQYKEYVGWSIWFYDRDPNSFPLLQCFWPDMAGKFPWEPECEQWAIDRQPRLDKPKEEPPKEK